MYKNPLCTLSCHLMIWTLLLIHSGKCFTQPSSDYWQQQVRYEMEIDFDVNTHQFSGDQKLVYTNHSPDTLTRVFYHLYFNAFQPGSMMDVRSRTIKDPDRRVKSRIKHLKPTEMGYHKVASLMQDGTETRYEVEGTILEVELAAPIFPGDSTVLEMKFDSQVPIQVRRSGRDNREGIAYSMTQWFPKMAEYDYEGWHADPYVGREYHGVWGDYEVKITIDSSYMIGGSGYLQNPTEIGHGYTAPGETVTRPAGDKLTWHFVAPKVHDFAWAADPDYVHRKLKMKNGVELHFIYQEDSLQDNWEALPAYTRRTFEMMNQRFGKYPYKQFTVIQGGDGGMEYPMATVITGNRSLRSLVSVTVHEAIHSWYYLVLGFNESRYPWMDEGFTVYAQNIVMDMLFSRKAPNPHSRSYFTYMAIVNSDAQEPMSTHGDHYSLNRTYSASTYSKGAVFLHQLSYVIGQKAFDEGMLRFYHTWKFKHPDARDFKRIMEKVSGLELDWYFDYWIYSTKTIDYQVSDIRKKGKTTLVTLKRIGEMPMPVDLKISYTDGSHSWMHIPLGIMRGAKGPDSLGEKVVVGEDWPWTNPEYTLSLDIPRKKIEKIEIDPSTRMADMNPKNNVFPRPPESAPFEKK